ncbi:serine/threonine protein phosphatase [Sphingobacteriales bacterium UPWRP_1]|nr:serine/threonine protein phosphatase [Sphingobacteriales bacterium UPWRP_1]
MQQKLPTPNRPAKMPRYAVSDIHGCKKTFEKLLFETLQLQKTDELYLLGDYIDRGPDSKGVIDLILQLREEGYRVFTLRGNHEDMMVSCLEMEYIDDMHLWVAQGGKETLQSFGVTNPHQIPSKYWQFFDELELYLELDDYLLVHAGFNFTKGNFFADELAMLWIRNWYSDIKPQLLNGKTIVHGHTPTPDFLIMQMADAKPYMVQNIDAGCVYYKYPGLGYLCAFNMDEHILYFQPNVDMPVSDK